jgi:hypothetical protein
MRSKNGVPARMRLEWSCISAEQQRLPVDAFRSISAGLNNRVREENMPIAHALDIGRFSVIAGGERWQ